MPSAVISLNPEINSSIPMVSIGKIDYAICHLFIGSLLAPILHLYCFLASGKISDKTLLGFRPDRQLDQIEQGGF